jgi:hypothetical protein
MRKSFTLVGFADKNDWATFHKEGYTERGSHIAFSRLVKSGRYECVVLREETEEYGVEISSPMRIWEKGINYIVSFENGKREQIAC